MSVMITGAGAGLAFPGVWGIRHFKQEMNCLPGFPGYRPERYKSKKPSSKPSASHKIRINKNA
jgi:hypothetical protein